MVTGKAAVEQLWVQIRILCQYYSRWITPYSFSNQFDNLEYHFYNIDPKALANVFMLRFFRSSSSNISVGWFRRTPRFSVGLVQFNNSPRDLQMSLQISNRIVVDVPRPRSECSGSVFLRWLTPLVRKARGCISLSARCLLTVSFGVNGEYLQFFSKCARYP